MVYVYAITDTVPATTDGRLGLFDRPIEVHTHDAITAVFSRHSKADTLTPSAQNVLRHERVVEAFMREGAVLPARFGTTFSDEGMLDATLARNHDRLGAGLAHVRGHVELGVRVLWDAPTSSGRPATRQAETGRAYMEARLAEERAGRERRRRAELLSDELHHPLARLSAGDSRRILPDPATLMAAAYLVPLPQCEAFRQRVHDLANAFPTLRILCTGPWPPYHFVPSLDDGRAGHD